MPKNLENRKWSNILYEKSMQDIAEELGMTRSQVSMILKIALSKICTSLEQKGYNLDDINEIFEKGIK